MFIIPFSLIKLLVKSVEEIFLLPESILRNVLKNYFSLFLLISQSMYPQNNTSKTIAYKVCLTH